MKKIAFLLVLFSAISLTASAQSSVLELEPLQSMSIAGKGPGQDAAINPYLDRNSVGIVENIGKNDFMIRIQTQNKIVKMVSIAPGETKEIDLLEGYEMYFDAEAKATARVEFVEMAR